MGHVRGGAGAGGVAEVAPAIGVELGKAALMAQDVLEGGERRGRPFLRPEAGIENPAVGVVERDHEVLRRSPASHACVEASRCTSMPTSGRRSRLRRYFPRDGAFATNPASWRMRRVHVYERRKPWCSTACS